MLKEDKNSHDNGCKINWKREKERERERDRDRDLEAASATALLELRALVLASCLVVVFVPRQPDLPLAALIFLFIHHPDAADADDDADDAAADDDHDDDDDDLMPQIAQDCPRPHTHLGLRMHCQRWMTASSYWRRQPRMSYISGT